MFKRIIKYGGIVILTILGVVVILVAFWYREDTPVNKLESNYLTLQSLTLLWIVPKSMFGNKEKGLHCFYCMEALHRCIPGMAGSEN
jgi:hypothetical protein